tara:strand:+ start:3532 stop:4551 length:1020 start_codon:yes stop_codon:yes gene_type:complete
MAKLSKVTETKVKQACRSLYEEGVAVTRDNVAERLGAKGSNTNVFKWIREFKSALENPTSNSDIDDEVQHSVQDLLDNINKRNQERLQNVRLEADRKINALTEELAEVEALNFELQQFKDQFLPTLENLQKKIAEANEATQAEKQKHAQSETKIEKLEEQLAHARSESKSLRHDLNASFDKYTSFTSNFASIREQDRDKFESQLEAVVNEKRQIELRLEATEERLTVSATTNAALTEKINHLESSLSEANSSLKLQEQYASLANTISTLSDVNQQKFESLSQTFSAILESTTNSFSSQQELTTSIKSFFDTILVKQTALENKVDTTLAEISKDDDSDKE